MKIALAMIVKGTEEEAKLLDQCLDNVSPYVDGIFLTLTHKENAKLFFPDKFIEVVKKYKAASVPFEWVNDFSKARNFSFSQVPKEYDYIIWADSDDIFRGLEKLRGIIEANPTVDAFAFNYLYAFDDHKNPIVVHKKTQVVRNDGCVTWQNPIHEDFKENRALNVKFVSEVERLHMADEKHNAESAIRNLEISKLDVKARKNDPTSHFNLANSYFQVGDYENARKEYKKFMKTSESNDEKYIVLQRLSAAEHCLGNRDESISLLKQAIGTFPDVPDAYIELGTRYFDYNRLDDAEYILLLGLAMKPRYHKMIVYNPRDYDYKPMHALAKVYLNKSRPDYALPLLEGCLKIYPNDAQLKGLVTGMKEEVERLKKVLETIAHIETLGDDKEKILYAIEKLPVDLQSHPAICRIRNQHFIKTESSGKDIAYYCGQTHHEWSGETIKTKGMGGSEEAVVNLSLQWAKMGYNVTVFNSCGNVPVVVDGVSYKPFWHYNPRDKYDHMILWRTPRTADAELNATNIYVDLHDVISEGEFTEKRLKKINKIFVKTKFHRSLFPNVSDEKFVVIPNGQDFKMFEQKVEKDPYLLVNTSSPDRSMDVLPKLFKRVKEQVPQARLKWCYGFDIFDQSNKDNKKMMEWRDSVIKEMEEVGIENCGRLSQADCAKLYLEGRILAYPANFAEIDCISVKKAQACGCIPVTTDFAAFEESVQYGVKVYSKKNKDNWAKPYQFTFGLDDKKGQDEWVEAVVKILKSPMKDETEMKEWSKKFAWDIIAPQWIENLK
jgi:tetratricopeptide (TPR) repeat protein